MDENSKLVYSSGTDDVSYQSTFSQSDATYDNVSARAFNRSSSLTAIHPVNLSFENITVVTIPKKTLFGKLTERSKHILRDVCGVVKPGTLIAIMGASGSGKTSLMNVLAHRRTKNLMTQGVVRVNGTEIGSDIRNISAYVQQEDLFIGTLTVREQLVFRALLRMEKSIDRASRLARVDEVIQELGLGKCADNMIGVPGRIKGISGGEMKRLSFASEVLTNPPLLFCDEPTSGLDSYMAANIVQSLQNMSRKGRTILCTIHQPSSDIFASFNDVLLLTEGRLAYLGPTSSAITFFGSNGYPCPSNYNPADHFILTLAIIPGRETECHERTQKLCETFQSSNEYQHITSQYVEQYEGTKDWMMTEVVGVSSRYESSWFTQFGAVFSRSWNGIWREPMLFKVRVIQSMVIAIMLGLVYLRLDLDQEGIQNINGLLFLCVVNMSMNQLFAVLNVFPREVPIFLREYNCGLYRVDVYYLCKMIAELPSFLLFPMIFISIVYWMTGMYESLGAFLVCSGVMLVVANVALAFGYIVSSLTSSVDTALSVAPPIMVPLMLFGGFFLNSASVPDYFIWLNYLSWFSYANEIVVINQWQDVDYIACPTKGDNCSQCLPNGQAVIEMMNYSKDNLYLDLGLLFALMVGFRILSFIFLFIRCRRQVS